MNSKCNVRLLMYFLVLLPAQWGWGDSNGSSVWEQMKLLNHQKIGIVKSIAVNDADNTIIIRINTQNGDGENYTVCPEYAGQKYSHILNTEKMELIRAAMAQGKPVKLASSGTFNSCVAHVEFVEL